MINRGARKLIQIPLDLDKKKKKSGSLFDLDQKTKKKIKKEKVGHFLIVKSCWV